MDPMDMDPVVAMTDRRIRRALGLVGLPIGLVMLSLSWDVSLALRWGANLAALVSVGLLLIAWNASARGGDAGWPPLQGPMPELARRLTHDGRRRLRETMQRRLVWHAERLGLVALGLWGLGQGLLALPE